MCSERILYTGANGQDGRLIREYGAEYKGYKLLGLTTGPQQTEGVIFWNPFDMKEFRRVVEEFQPTIVINTAALATGIGMYDAPERMIDVNARLPVLLMETLKSMGSTAHFLQLGSSEMFGNTPDLRQSERSPMWPRTPYGAAKMFAHHFGISYRDKFDFKVSNAICFNHDSKYRTEAFVTKKVVCGALDIIEGKEKKLEIFNLESKRDWSYAGDFVKTFFLMGEQTDPDDYVLASGELISVRNICETVFGALSLDYQDFVVELKPMEPGFNNLLGDPTKARRLGHKNSRDFSSVLVDMLNFEREKR